MPDDASVESVRDAVRAWLASVWDPDRPLNEWRELLADSGWGCPTWPVGCFGRGLSVAAGRVVTEESRRRGAVGPATGIAMTLVAPTLLARATHELQRRFLRPILAGEETWCQLFSEPGSGSDLAGLATRAERDGDERVVSGQKVWNSAAQRATFGMQWGSSRRSSCRRPASRSSAAPTRSNATSSASASSASPRSLLWTPTFSFRSVRRN